MVHEYHVQREMENVTKVEIFHAKHKYGSIRKKQRSDICIYLK